MVDFLEHDDAAYFLERKLVAETVIVVKKTEMLTGGMKLFFKSISTVSS